MSDDGLYSDEMDEELYPDDAEPEAYHYGYTTGWEEAQEFYSSEIEELRLENANLRRAARGTPGAL